MAGSNVVGDSYLRLSDSSGNEVAANDDASNGYGSNLSYLASLPVLEGGASFGARMDRQAGRHHLGVMKMYSIRRPS